MKLTITITPNSPQMAAKVLDVLNREFGPMKVVAKKKRKREERPA